ncbi:DUF192 domain-containing protein [bacterium]|nr:DUF192 domain-containing protein [bacterium]
MKFMKVINETKNIEISKSIGLATALHERILGLMFKKSIDHDGLFIKPCNSIHTFFCFFPLDIYFLDRENIVIKVIHKMRPWRITRLYFTSKSVLEFKSVGKLREIDVGDKVDIVCLS